MTSIYVLSLANGKYYVGRSDHVGQRVFDHYEGNGCAWTKKYPPQDLIAVYENAIPFDEDRYTKEYMARYGVDNVRGGAYCTIDLDESTKQHIEREIRSAYNLCFECGQPGHMRKECLATKSTCDRCGRNNHVRSQCYAKTHYDGTKLIEGCERCHRSGHLSDECRAMTYADGTALEQTSFLINKNEEMSVLSSHP